VRRDIQRTFARTVSHPSSLSTWLYIKSHVNKATLQKVALFMYEPLIDRSDVLQSMQRLSVTHSNAWHDFVPLLLQALHPSRRAFAGEDIFHAGADGSSWNVIAEGQAEA
jgi:hypothetical protein